MCRGSEEPPGDGLGTDPLTPYHFPSCRAEFEIHRKREWSVGEDGKLVTSRYGPANHIEDFCVDYLVNSQEMIAVTCDLCKGRKVMMRELKVL